VKLRPDKTSFLGLAIALGGIVGGLILEGGQVSDITQITAALIVVGGTLGAVMVTTPQQVLVRAASRWKLVFFEPDYKPSLVLAEILRLANRARRSGVVALERELDSVQDPFLRKALNLGVDGTDVQGIRSVMELELQVEEEQGRAEARVYESAGGYAPTVGIIGAVLGLIQVMKQLDKIDQVGHGIAVAFVATVYGVGLANVIFLPAANKLRARLECRLRAKDLMLEGACAIIEGQHPKLIERRLEAYLRDEHQAIRGDAAMRRRSSDAPVHESL
jgi:chemotaxis protein MotA